MDGASEGRGTATGPRGPGSLEVPASPAAQEQGRMVGPRGLRGASVTTTPVAPGCREAWGSGGQGQPPPPLPRLPSVPVALGVTLN